MVIISPHAQAQRSNDAVPMAGADRGRGSARPRPGAHLPRGS